MLIGPGGLLIGADQVGAGDRARGGAHRAPRVRPSTTRPAGMAGTHATAPARRRCSYRDRARCRLKSRGTGTARTCRRSREKRQRRLSGGDQIILSLSATGLTTGEIAAHIADVYGATVSKDTISKITDKVVEEMTEWRDPPLDGGRLPGDFDRRDRA